MAGRIRVALIFGGRSSEHEVSCVSARHVAAAMDPERYEVVPIGITRQGRWLLADSSRRALQGGPLEIPEVAFQAQGEPVAVVGDAARREIVALDSDRPQERIGGLDVVFPVLHGPYGEDGCVQGLLEMADLPYVGAGVLGSALGMDKEKMKVLFRACGLAIGDFVVVRAHEWASDRGRVLDDAVRVGFPSFAKPANLGSSVGISRCTDPETLEKGIDLALRYDRKVLVEEGISGREIECAVLGGDAPEASVPGEIIPGRDFYDYVAKYLDDSSRLLIPAPLEPAVTDRIRADAVTAFKAIDGWGMARVDFFYEQDARGVVVNEINTIPGFTTISMYPKLWEASGLSYPALIDRLIELAFERHRTKPRPEELPPPTA